MNISWMAAVRVLVPSNMVSKKRIFMVEPKVSAVPAKPEEVKWSLLRNFKAYCSSTPLHGFSYIMDDKISPLERIIWTVVIVSAIGCTIFLLWLSWDWNEQTHTITVIETTHYPTMFVPFPAVTICSFNKISRTKAFKIASSWKRPANLSVEELMRDFRLMLHFKYGKTAPNANYTRLQELIDQHNTTIEEVLFNLSPDCQELFVKCLWKRSEFNCDEMFRNTITTFGYCCSFNYFGRKGNQTIHTEPQRVSACDHNSGLSLLLKPRSRDYFASSFKGIGFEVLVHYAYDFPDESTGAKLISGRTQNFFGVLPESRYATENVRDMDVSQRQCLFSDERKLEIMERYSYINCMVECRSRIAYEVCGCVPSFLLRPNKYSACRLKDIDCIFSNKWYIMGSTPGVNDTLTPLTQRYTPQCECLDDCQNYRYPGELARASLKQTLFFRDLHYYQNSSVEGELVLHVYFTDLISPRYRQDKYHSWIEMLALFGGICELIIGFSFVTGFEFIYYFTLRPVFDYWAKKLKNSAP